MSSRLPKNLTYAACCVCLLVGTGCGGASVQSPSPVTNSDLKTLNLACANFYDSYDRAPSDIDELAPYIVTTVFPEAHRKLEEECLKKLKSGDYVVVWNQPKLTDPAMSAKTITAYEGRIQGRGGFVVYSDGEVVWMMPHELEAALLRQKSQAAKSKTDVGQPDK